MGFVLCDGWCEDAFESMSCEYTSYGEAAGGITAGARHN